MRVAVLLPAYNAERTLREAVESVLAQTYTDFELVLVDDGSTDGTLTLMRAFAERDRRVRVITHPNMGMGASLNHAMATIDDEWVARMDADDVMMPTRLARQVAFLEARPEAAVASCLVDYIGEDGRTLAKSTSDLLSTEDCRRYVRNNDVIALTHPGVIMNRRVILDVGGYRPQFWPAEDIDLWNRVAEAGYNVLVQPEYLMKYRIHADSICVGQQRLALRQIRWVERCMLDRRAGLPEPPREAFLASERNAPWVHRLNRQRKETALVLYKAAAYHYGTARYAAGLPMFAGAVCLAPRFAFGRFRSKVLRMWIAAARRGRRTDGQREPADPGGPASGGRRDPRGGRPSRRGAETHDATGRRLTPAQ